MKEARLPIESSQGRAPELCGLEDWIKAPIARGPTGDAPVVRVADLFSGCGGLTLGAEEGLRQHGMTGEPRLVVDMMEAAIDVYVDNLIPGPFVRTLQDSMDGPLVHCGDVCGLLALPGTQLSSVELRLGAKVGGIDLLIAGPPCQGHSDLNNHSRRDDPRNSLYLRAVRAVEVLEPSAVILENVPTVLHDRSDVVGTAKRELARLGYEFDDAIIKAADLGMPQRRRRHFLVASRIGRPVLASILQPHIREGTPVWPYLEDLAGAGETPPGIYSTPSGISDVNRQRMKYLFEHDLYDLPDEMRPDCHRTKSHSYKSVYGRLHPERPAQTITSGFGSMGQGRYVHPTQPRTLTPHEAARLQGFPDFFDFSSVTKRTRLHEMIGNAVPPRMAAVLVWSLVDHDLLVPDTTRAVMASSARMAVR